jgi:hypothetical protein
MLLYYPCLRPTIGLCSLMPTNPQGKPYSMFLSVHSQFCLQLPSDLRSPSTPLLLANDSHWLARSGFAPYRYMVCVAHNKKPHSNRNRVFQKKGDEPSLRTRRTYKRKNPSLFRLGFHKERRRHTLPHNCSTICAGGLNYSVRDGKR